VYSITMIYISAREAMVQRMPGQTMTEYALIIASIGVVVWAAYHSMGQNIGTMANGIDSDLTSA
jgi:Flp pilus assembly pilin Flp